MGNKEIKKQETENKNSSKPRVYTELEQTVAKNADKLIDLTNSLIIQTKEALIDVWSIDTSIDPNKKTENPTTRLIEMFEWYINEWEKHHAAYLKNNNLKLSKEDKSKLKEIDKNKPAEVKPAKQVKELILG